MDQNPLKILVVDDDEDDYILIRHMLSKARQGDYIVDWAPNFDKGWKLLQGGDYDVILMDYDLPPNNGLDLTRKAVELGCHSPIILVTGRGSYEVDLEAMNSGATLYLTKSEISPLILERSIRYAIEHKQIEEKLTKSEAWYRTVLATLPVGIGIFDTEGRLVESNPIGSHIFGTGVEGELPSAQLELTSEPPGGMNPRIRGTLISKIMCGESFSGQEVSLQSPDGRNQLILVSGSPVNDSEGRLMGAVITGIDISERQRLEAELKASEKRYRELVRYAPAAIYEADFLGKRFITVNDAMCELLGYSREELLAMSPFDLLDEKGKIRFQERIQQWSAGEEPEKNVEYKVRAKDGGTIYALLNTTFTKDAEGQPVSATVIGFDITDRRQAEEVARNQHELLKTVIQNTPVAMNLMRGKDMRIQVINPAYQIFVSEEDIVGKSIGELQLETDLKLLDIRRHVLVNGEPYHVNDEFRMIRRSPDSSVEPAYFNWSLFRVDLPGEKGWGILHTAWETTERVRATGALIQSQKHVSRLMDTSYEGIWSVDQDGKTTFLNHRAAEILGYTREEILGVDAFEFLMSGEVSAGRQTLAKIAAGESGRVEAHAQRKDGSEAILLVSYSPVMDEYGNFQGALAMFTDITERKQAEKAVQETSRRLKEYTEQLEARVRERTEELVQLQRRLVDTMEAERLWVSQDLHDGPMQEIYGVMYKISSFTEGMDNPELQAEIASVVEKLKTINEDLRRLTGELRPASLTPFGLEKAIREHSESFDREYPELHLSLDLMPDGKILSEHVRLSLFRIYQTALSNVIRHAEAENVSVRLSLDADVITLEIEDDGKGFEVPKRIRTLARQGHFGLAGAVERAEAIGATLEVISAPGKGTRLKVVAPLREEQGIPVDSQHSRWENG